MPFCPQCKCEYRDGVKRCADCSAALVDSLPEEPAQKITDTEQALLAVVSGGMDAGAVEGLLRDAEIPYAMRNAGAHRPTIVTGLTGDVAFFVPSDRLAEAKDLLHALPSVFPDEETPPIPADDLLDESHIPRRRKIIIWVAVALFLFALWVGVFPKIIYR